MSVFCNKTDAGLAQRVEHRQGHNGTVFGSHHWRSVMARIKIPTDTTTTTRTTSPPGLVDRARRDENMSRQETTDLHRIAAPGVGYPDVGGWREPALSSGFPTVSRGQLSTLLPAKKTKPYRVPTLLHQTQLVDSGTWGQLNARCTKLGYFFSKS